MELLDKQFLDLIMELKTDMIMQRVKTCFLLFGRILFPFPRMKFVIVCMVLGFLGCIYILARGSIYKNGVLVNGADAYIFGVFGMLYCLIYFLYIFILTRQAEGFK